VLPVLLVFLCGGFVLYVLFGYPLLVRWLSRRSARPVRKSFTPRSVSVLLPVRNEAALLKRKLETLRALDYPRELVEIIVVSDGSTDDSAAIAERFGGIRVLEVPSGGKALALNAGLDAARGEILFLTDVRQDLDPAALRELIAHFGDPAVGVVSGELIIRAGETSAEANVGAYWKYEKWIRGRLSEIDSVIGATGAIYAMRRDLARKMPPGTLLDDVYLPLCAFFAGYRVTFEPRARAYDYPTSLPGEFRRKVRTLAGNYQLLTVFPALLHPTRNRMWIHFLSHKFGRLLVPWALLGLAVASAFLPAPWFPLLLIPQAAFYGIGLLDSAVPEGTLLKRLTSPVRTFLTLMAASACAVSFFLVPPETLWRGTTKVGS
jgi:cellulose synthase/poly-beta-1,6-N-acetylglucosamine synthase-like glycosyltransferase